LKNTFYPTVFMTVALLVFALLAVPQAFAVTFTVNSTDDLPDDLTKPGICHTAINTCTLRAAVMQANRTSGAGATIIIPAGIYTLTIPAGGEEGGSLDLTTPASGLPVITIIGAGASTTIIDGNQLDRVFDVSADRIASITGVTIQNGYCFFGCGNGGGIYNRGTLEVKNSTISGNSAFDGGGIFNYISGYLEVTNSTISGNPGGGISNSGTLIVTNSTISRHLNGFRGIYSGSYLKVTNSTISGNLGGGIYGSGTLIVTNSTISQNFANTDGGGIYNDGTLTVTNSTISQNFANTSGGGIYNLTGAANVYNSTITGNGSDYDRDPNGGIGGGVYNGGTFNLRNTLVAGNYTANAPVPDDCYGTLGSFGRNLFGDLTGCTVNTGSGSWDYFNGGLGPLQNNGGPTWTQALLPGSNAIDGGDPVQGCIGPDALPLATDQRGGARVVGGGCDIGAFEYGAILPRLYLPLIFRN
jgi:hypothetical protein